MAADDLIKRYLSHLRSESASSRTITDRQRILGVIDRELPYGLDGATEEELRAWLWRDGLKIGSRETYYGAFASFYRWAYTAGVLDFNPAEGIKRPRVPDRIPNPITDEELAQVLIEAAEPYCSWMTLAAYAGMRCIEISRADRADFTKEQVRIPLGKGGKSRVVGTHPVVWDLVEGLPAGPLTTYDERYISIRSSIYFSRVLKLRGVTLHRGRHWFGTNIQRLYRDLLVTQQAMGHANPKSTAGYALVAAESVSAAVAMLPTVVEAYAGRPEGRRVPRQLPPAVAFSS